MWVTTKTGKHINTDWFEKDKQIESNKKEAEQKNVENKKEDIQKHKQQQLEIIQKYNPKNKNINAQATWIESVKDIQTWEEAMHDDEYGEGDVTPDFTWEDAQKAFKNGFITIYSSKPIKQGSFVTPSKMLAVSYGNKNPYSMKVPLTSVAWIDMSEGQFADLNKK